MLPSLFKTTTFESLEQTISFAERRHNILASNIANMDTPDYQTRDLSVDDFQASIKDLIATRKRQADESPTMRFSVLQQNEASDLTAARDQAVQNVHDAMRQVVYNDGSDDNLELQATQAAKNKSLHEVAVTLLRSQFKALQMAISESVNV
ncbi:flagellar basal body rod protein FlgB [Pirellulaceae bacterium SH449]